MGRLTEEAGKRKISSQRACNGCGRVAPTKTYEIRLKKSQLSKSKQRHALLRRISEAAGGLKVSKQFEAHLCYACDGMKTQFGKFKHIKRDDRNFVMQPW